MKNVLLIDSGSGGVNILKECVKVCPYCNFLLFCDDANLPYGSKTKDELQKITLENLKNIKAFFDFDIVILACNTLTCTCIERCREAFAQVNFIGTVPAIRPAIKNFKDEDVLVLATPVTIKHNILINKHRQVKTLALANLAQSIDENLDNLEVLENDLRAAFESYFKLAKFEKCKKNASKMQKNRKNNEFLQFFKPKAVVLGCTHYVAVENLLRKILGEDVAFFNSANGVARRLKYFVELDCPNPEKNFQVQIMVSGNQNNLAKFCWWFNK